MRLAEVPMTPSPIPVLPRPVPSASPSVPDAYRVQVVAANTQEVADEMLARAKKAGFSGIVVKDGGYFKVRLGEYATRAEASAAATKVKAKLGGSPFVVAP
jgi:cell division septation protein DedD